MGVGFVDGEGCFYVGINPHPEMSSKFQVLPEFTVVSIAAMFNCSTP